MTELQKSEPVVTPETDGVVSEVQTQTEETKTYSAEFVDKLMKEKKNFQSKARELEEAVKRQEEKALLEKEEFKTLYENTLKENENLKGSIEQHNQMRIDSAKMEELKREFGKLGLQPTYFDKATKLIDVKSINYDADTGVITGAEEAAKALQSEMPVLFGKASTNVSSAAPQGSPKPLSLDEWKTLSNEEKLKRENELYAFYGVKRTN